MDRYELPPGWVWTTLEALASKVNPGFPSGKHNKSNQGVPHLRPMNVAPGGKIDLSEVKYVEVSDYDTLQKGDVLFNNTNSPEWVGKTAYIAQDTNWAYSNHMTRIRFFPDSVNSGWIAFYLHYLTKTGFFKMNCTHHVNQASINTSFLSTRVSLPLPPLGEQQRIVDEIEAQFTRLDAVVAALKRAQVTLKRYRASVLKTACEGRLVPQDPTDEPAGQLLERILAERRQQWNGRGPYTEPVSPDYKGLSIVPDLPENWIWASIDQITRNFDGIRVPVRKSDRAEVQGEYPYYGATGIIDSVNDFLFDGNYLLIAEDGKNLIYRNKPIAFQAHGKFWVNNHAHIVQTLSGCPLGFLENYLNSIDVTFYTTGIDQIKLNQANMNKIPVPLPPLAEQQRIVEEVERRLSVMDEVEAALEANLKRAERLRQSILKRAFAGKLVPQNPADEPASVLLGRIKKAKAEAKGDRQMGLPGVT